MLWVVGCSANVPNVLTVTPTLARIATETAAAPSATPLPPPKAIDLGVLGKGSANDIAWAPDGSTLAVASSTGVYLYDTQTWQVWRTIPNEKLEDTEMFALVFSPNGESLFLTSTGFSYSFWRYDLQNEQVNNWPENVSIAPRTAPVFSPDGETFAFINLSDERTEDGTYRSGLELRESATGQLLHQLQQNDFAEEKVITSFVFSPDNKQIAVGSHDHLVRVWDITSGNLLYELQHDSDVADVAYRPDSKVLVSTGKDATVRFWDTQTGEMLFILRGFEAALQYVAYLEDGEKLLLGQLHENVFQQYTLDDDNFLAEPLDIVIEAGINFNTHPRANQVTTIGVRLSPDTQKMAVLLNSQVYIWNVGTGQLILTLPEYNSQIYALEFSLDGSILVMADHDIHLWEVSTQKWRTTLQLDAYEIQDISFHPDGELLAVSTYGGNVEIWDTVKQQKVRENSTDVDWCNSSRLAFSPNGDKLATAGWCGIRIWEPATGQLLQKMEVEKGCPRELAFSAEGNALICVGERGFWRWDLQTGKAIYAIPLPGEYNYWTVALRQNLMVLGQGSNGPFLFFDPVTGQHLYDFAEGRGGKTVALNPDGRLFARADYSQILLADSVSGKKLLSLDFRLPYFISFSPQDNRLVASSSENTAHLWDISAFAQHANSLVPLTATPDLALTPTPTVTPEPIFLQPQIPPALGPDAIRPENIERLVKLGERGLGRIHTAAWAPDGKRLAMGGYPGVLMVNLDTLELSPPFIAEGDILSLAFSPDGNLLAGQITNSAIQMWEVTTGRSLYILENTGCWNRGMTFSPDGQILSAHCGGYRWSMSDGQLLDKGQANPSLPKTSLDGDLVLQWGMLSAKLLVHGSDEIIQTFDMPGMAPGWAQFSPDGKTLAVWFYQFEVARSGVYYPGKERESVLQLWNIVPGETATLRTTLATGKWYQGGAALQGTFQGLAFTPDSQMMATASGDGWVQIWDTTSGELLHTLPGYSQVHFSPDGRQLMSLTDKALRIWDLSPGKEPEVVWEISDMYGYSSLMFTRNGQELVTTSYGSFQFWSLAGELSEKPIATLEVMDNERSRMAASPDGKWLAYSSVDEFVLGESNPQAPHWQTLEIFAEVPHKSLAHALVFSPDSSLLTMAHPGHKTLLWKLRQPDLTPIALASSTYVSNLVFSPDSKLLLGWRNPTSRESALYLWETETGQLLRTWNMLADQFVFHPDGITLAAAEYKNGDIRLFDLRTGDLVQEIKCSSNFHNMAFSPDGSLLAIIAGGKIGFWEVASGELLKEIEGAFNLLAFSPDGKWLAVGLYDGRIQYWGLSTK